MELVTTKQQLTTNIETLERYLTEGDSNEMKEAVSLVKKGICFVAYKASHELRFAPSRFIGYVENNVEKHSLNEGKHGTITNNAIKKIIGIEPLPNEKLELQYIAFCNKLGIYPSEKATFGAQRKFWVLDIVVESDDDIEQSDEFPEGRLVERKHKARERNSQVISLAKDKFRIKHGRLFCQACGFDFEQVYGDIGKDFIEGHHTIAVKDMKPDHKTKVEDIAMLCSNCHRMVHKRRPWLTINEMNRLI